MKSRFFVILSVHFRIGPIRKAFTARKMFIVTLWPFRRNSPKSKIYETSHTEQIYPNDYGPHPQPDRKAGHPDHSQYADHFFLCHGRYLFCWKINTQSTAAVGISFSIMAIIQAFGFFFGHGSGNYISRKLGAQDYKSAEKMASTGFFYAFFAGTLIMVLGLIFYVRFVWHWVQPPLFSPMLNNIWA